MRRMFMFPSAIVAVLVTMFWPGQMELGTVAHAGKWGSSTMVHFGFIAPAGPYGAAAESDSYPVRDKETIQRTFDLGTSARSIDVDNVDGAIEVVGTDSNQVTLTIEKTIRAESEALAADARREVKLDVTHEGGRLKLFVDGPFRCWCGNNDRRSVNFRGDLGYRVEMNFKLHVPRDTDVRVSTVNNGDIRVRDVRGQFSVSNVNGSIQMQGMAGAGKAHTVNGEVKVTFRENPRAESSFKSVNGDIDLHFVRGLSADFRFKTFNGDVYSDFAVTALPQRGMERVTKGSRTIFRSDRYTSGRVGAGGVEIRTENLNGDIRIRETQ